MIAVTQETILLSFIVFCRVGSCFMILPGISGGRVPPQVRLFLALAVALAIAPLVTEGLRTTLIGVVDNPLPIIASECITGLLLGFLIRAFFMALEFSAVAMANFMGYGSVFSHSIEGNDASSPIANAIMLPATALFFIFDQHVKIIDVLQSSYVSLPPDHPFDLDPTMRTIGTMLGSAFRIALQVCAPLLIYSLALNLLFGLLNKMVPQIPAYFISAPFLMLGGLAILYLLIGPMMLEFSAIVEQSMIALGKNG